jgi:hypothetical protein
LQKKETTPCLWLEASLLPEVQGPSGAVLVFAAYLGLNRLVASQVSLGSGVTADSPQGSGREARGRFNNTSTAQVIRLESHSSKTGEIRSRLVGVSLTGSAPMCPVGVPKLGAKLFFTFRACTPD